jgi:hypothetical protein
MKLKKTIATGTVHKLPSDLKKAIFNNSTALKRWNSLTSLARNE